MNQLLRKLIDIREGEFRRTLIMAGYLFLIISAYNILKPMTRSLFVTNLGLEELPKLYMILAGVGGILVIFYLRISNNVRLDRLINGTSIVLITNLMIFWAFLHWDTDSSLLYYSFYIWTSIFGVLTTTQFWLLANHLFNAREAKRLFPFLATCAILGGIAGGYVARFTVTVIGGTTNLAFICIAFLAIAAIFMNVAWQLRDTLSDKKPRARGVPDSGHSFQVVKEIRQSRHLASIIGIVAFTFMVVQIADFQFTAYAAQEFTNADELTGFLGFWLSNLSIAALAFQVLFANSIIKRFGVVAAILFLPVVLLVSSLWVFLSYGLISILAVKVGDGAFRHSINKVGTELLFLPIPAEVKEKTKAFVDMFADRFARGVAGFLLFIFYTWLGLSVAQISLVSVILVLGWLALALVAYREYVNSFRQALAKRKIDADLVSVSITDEASINLLVASLASRNERQVVYALRLLESVDTVELVPPLTPLLEHSSEDVRSLTLQILQQRGNARLLPKVKPLLYDKHESVRREAVRFYAKYSDDDVENLVSAWLGDKHSGLRGATLYFLAEKKDLTQKLLNPQLIESFLRVGESGRIQVAVALGVLQDTRYHDYLQELLQDPVSSVRLQAIQSAGRVRDPKFVPILIENLGERAYRKASREALAEYGDNIIDFLAQELNDVKFSTEVRTEMPRVLGLIGSQKAIAVLLENLSQKNEAVRYQAIKALNKLRTQYPELSFDRRVEQALLDEFKKYFAVLDTLHLACHENSQTANHTNLLERALRERLDDHLERIFRLLGLCYPPRDIYNAYAATVSKNRNIRASAVEFLDNILSNNHKRILLPVVEDVPVEHLLRYANGYLEINMNDRLDALRHLIEGQDNWLRACALYEIGKSELIDEFQIQIEQASQERDPLVQETAHLILKQFA